MATAVKQSRRGRAQQRETEEQQARLRRYLARLTDEKPGDGSDAYDYRPRLTTRMALIMLRIDGAMVGTPDYMGLAYWWGYAYKFDLREATPKQRKRAHDAILAAGLPLRGESAEHARIVAWATNNGEMAAKAMGVAWKPWKAVKR